MNWYSLSLAISLSLALSSGACSKAPPQEAAPSKGNATPTEARPIPKKPVDTKPLPPLAKDPGGATGKPLRATGFGGLGIDAGRAIAVTPAGEAYVVGYFDGEGDFGPAGKLKAAGDQTVKKNAPADAFVVKLVVDGQFSDEMKLGEFSKKAMGADDLFVASFDPTGGVRWLWHAGGRDSDGANAVAATPDGGWIIGGSYTGTATFGTVELKSRGGSDGFLLKLNAAGDLEWVKSFGGRYPDRIKHLGVDGQ